MKNKINKPRNLVAKDMLSTNKYKMKVQKDRTKYSRKIMGKDIYDIS